MHCIRTWLSIAPILLLAGCWEKIEYSGPSPAVAKSSASAAAASVQSDDPAHDDAPSSAPVASIPEPSSSPATASAAASTYSPTATPVSSATPIAVADDDRYATPTKATEPNSIPAPPPDVTPIGSTQPEPPRHANVAAVSATIEVAPRAAFPKTRRAAWHLGSRLSLAALAHDRGMAANNVPAWVDEARAAAKSLETSVADLPEPATPNDPAPASRQVIEFLIGQGQAIGTDLSQRHGQEHAALLEVALKSNILLLHYSPGSNNAASISAAISRAAPLAKLPPELWKPVVDHIKKKSSLNDVRTAVKQMHADVDRYLANAAEPAGR